MPLGSIMALIKGYGGLQCSGEGGGGTQWRGWLKHCATKRKVAGLISDGVIGIFHWHNPSGRTMALGSTQLLKQLSARNIFWLCVGLRTLPPYLCRLEIYKSESLNLLEHSRQVQICTGLLYFFTLFWEGSVYFVLYLNEVCNCCSSQISHKTRQETIRKRDVYIYIYIYIYTYIYIRVVQIALERGCLSSQERKYGGRPLF
jgi:hypothetical protein